MAHELPPLPYPTNALEPHIDAKALALRFLHEVGAVAVAAA